MFVILKDIFLEAMPGRDKFYKIINENGLMLKPERRRHTTNSNHNYRKYKNLTQGLVITRPNQLWVADITYVDTDDGVMYLHLVTDAWTHEIIGWMLSDSLMASNTIAALKMGIEHNEGADLSELIHHSDRGSQYCSNAYIDILNSHQRINIYDGGLQANRQRNSRTCQRHHKAGMAIPYEETQESG